MFGLNYLKNAQKEFNIVQYKGIFRKEISNFEAVALIVSGTIGAGILGLPYAISKVGSLIGILYLLGIGLLTMGLNLMIGEILVRTQGNHQLVGLAEKYLGNWGKRLMTLLLYSSILGVLVIYIIGEGEALSTIFGGPAILWSIGLFPIALFLIYRGMRVIKAVDFFLTLGILSAILVIIFFSSRHIEFINFKHIDFAQIFFPYGVILFAFSGSAAVVESHSLLKNKEENFKKVIIWSSLIIMAAYSLFSLVIFGVTGNQTTEIATIGLGSKLGHIALLLGNIFAAFAMGTSFLLGGLAIKDSFTWDYKMSNLKATILTCGIPMLVFLLGLRSFIKAMDLVGGVFFSLEMLLIIMIYWKAKKIGDIEPSKYKLHHTLLLACILVVALSVGAVYSVVKLF